MGDPGTQNVFGALPRPLQNRIQSLGAAVGNILEELQRSNAVEPSLDAEEVTWIKLMVISQRLEQFFEDSSRAAEEAIRGFRMLGQVGFRVGATEFTEGNENVLRGRRLAAQLRETLGASIIAESLSSAISLTDQVRVVRREVIRVRRLG